MPLTHCAVLDGPVPRARWAAGALSNAHFGGLASFIGVVRDHHHGAPVRHLYYEAYREMALTQMERFAEDLRARSDAELAISIEHATGLLQPGEAAVAIHVAAAHRAAACDGCRALIETLKRELPVWKRETYADGSSRWMKGP